MRAKRRELELERVREHADQIRERCRSFAEFFKLAWHVLEPTTPLRWNWHLQAICDHLQGITEGKIHPRLIINVPPGCSKSTLVSVMWQAWEWGPCGLRGNRFLSTSYEKDVVDRDSRKTRDLILSEWYQTLWPEVCGPTGKLKRGGESSFENWDRGTREGVPFSSLTGKRGDRLMIDDPHSLDGAESETEREKAVRRFLEGGQNRLNDMERSAIVLVMQRLHEMDLTGALLAREMGYVHLMLPMEFEVERRCVTHDIHGIEFFVDPRTYEGELLDPVRFPAHVVQSYANDNEYAHASQNQQRPVPREGGMFKIGNLVEVESVPAGAHYVRGWDIAGSTRKKSPFTVGFLLAWDGIALYIVDIRRERKEIDQAEALIIQTAREDKVRYGTRVKQSIPQDPGSAGKPVWVEHLVTMGDGKRKPLSEVGPGDSVIGIDGRSHLVLNVFEQGELDCLKISTLSGRQIFAAPDHPFFTPGGWREAGELTVGEALGLRSGCDSSGSQRSNAEFRLAGYFIGDGSVGRSATNGPNGSCDAGFVTADPETLADFKECVEGLGGSIVRRSREYQYGARGMQQWLRDTSIAGHTAYTKRVPDWVFEGSREQIAHFIGAYMATDGTVDVAGKEAVFYSVSHDLLRGVQSLLVRLGIHSHIRTKNGKYLETRHRSWLLRLSQKEDALGIFAREVPVFHSIKRSRIANWSSRSNLTRFPSDFVADPIVSIENAGRLPCRCLEVEGVHTFLVEDVVVHNSQKLHLSNRLAGLEFIFSTETGAKEDRAIPFASMVNSGSVRIVIGGNPNWKQPLLDEMGMFPGSAYKDQVDAGSRAFMEIAKLMGDDSEQMVYAPRYGHKIQASA